MHENEEEKRIARIKKIMEQRKDLNYDFDRERKRRKLTDFLSDHKKEFINWLKEEGYDVEKIQYIAYGDYREHGRLHKSFSKYYFEKQKAKYKNLLEETLIDTEKYNNVLKVILDKKIEFSHLRIFTSSLQPQELEQMGIISTEKYITEELFFSLYTFFQDLLTEHKLKCQEKPNEWIPEIFKIKSDNKDEVKQEHTGVLRELIDAGQVRYVNNEYEPLKTMPELCRWMQQNGFEDIPAKFIHIHIKNNCTEETIKRYQRDAKEDKKK